MMAITGYLAEFSLAELFQFLEQGNKVGLLTICTLLDSESGESRNHHIWFNQGRIVAAAHTLDQRGLLRLIRQRGWLGDRAASRLAQSCALNTPMGLCLKSQGALNAEQLKLLFYVQVMQQVCALFSLKDGWFQFDSKAPLPVAEMTGLSAPATEITLAGLRAIKDWSALNDKLPEATSALASVIDGKPNLKLNQSEWQVWEYTNGTIALNDVASQLQLPIEKVQQIAFRLIVAGLTEEIPLIGLSPVLPEVDRSPLNLEESPASDPSSEASQNSSSQASSAQDSSSSNTTINVSQSFLKNLVGFLSGNT